MGNKLARSFLLILMMSAAACSSGGSVATLDGSNSGGAGGGSGTGGGATGGSGTGTGIAASSLTLSPTGPVAVKKGQTLQFTATPNGATFTVVGGAANGTIDATGLYTPPSQLPPNATVTVQAALNSQTATATVNLTVGDSVKFGQPPILPLNQNPIPMIAIALPTLYSGANNLLGVDDGASGRQTYLSWINGTTQSLDDSGVYLSVEDVTGKLAGEKRVGQTAGAQVVNFVGVDLNHHLTMLITDDADGSGPNGGQLEYLESDDGGKTFNTPVPIKTDLTHLQIQGSMAFAPGGVIHMVYTNAAINLSMAKVYYARSDDGGAHWTTTQALSVPDMQLFPSIAVDATGNSLCLCWSQAQNVPNAKADIFCGASKDGGKTFVSAPVNVTNTAGVSEDYSHIAMGSGGEIYVSFSGTESNADVYLIKSTDGGAHFSSPVTVNKTTVNLQILPFLSVGPDGAVDMIWSSGSSGFGSLMYARSTDGGKTFSNDVTIAGGTTNLSTAGMGLAHDDAGRLLALYMEDVANDPNHSVNVYLTEAQ